MNFKKCVIFWHGFPSCGHMLTDLSIKLGNNLHVIATKPKVPFSELGSFLHNKIIYLDQISDIWSHWNLIKNADIFIHTGWCFADINKIDKKLKKEKYKTKVFILVDNRLKYSLKQIIGYFIFKKFYSKIFDGYIVAGKKSKDLLIFFGINEEKIATGHYGAPEDFYPRSLGNITAKKNRFVFVGSLNRRKGYDILIKAWDKYQKSGGTWELAIVGEELQHGKALNLNKIIQFGFRQPHEVAQIMQESTALILPSRDDNWATVLAEGAASGCILVSTNNVGATYDLIKIGENGYILSNYYPVKSLFTIFREIEFLDKIKRDDMCKKSIIKSEEFKALRLTHAINVLAAND